MRAFAHRRAAIATVVAVAAAVFAGGAAGFWGAAGTGSDGSTAGTGGSVTLSPGTATSALYPAGSADVAVSIVNASPNRVFVGSLALDADRGTNGFSVDGGHAACNLTGLSYATQTNGGAGWFTAASSSSDLDLAGAVSLSPAAVSACQGAQVTVYLEAAPS